MTRIAIYPGSFDPPTRGHEDLIRRALGLADRVVVAVAVNLAKQPLFSLPERLELLRTVIGTEPRVEITSFEGLLAEYARKAAPTATTSPAGCCTKANRSPPTPHMWG